MRSGQIKRKALKVLEGNYLEMFFIMATISVIMSAINFRVTSPATNPQDIGRNIQNIVWVGGTITSLTIHVLITGAVNVGVAHYSLDMIKNPKNTNRLNLLGNGFKRNYVNIIVTYLLMIIYLFLWFVLFIIPGIIKTFSYAMVPFILAEDKDISPNDAITKSREIMDGQKARLFLLALSFIGWFLLAAIIGSIPSAILGLDMLRAGLLGTIISGISVAVVMPYLMISVTIFYNDIKEKRFDIDAQYEEESQAEDKEDDFFESFYTQEK